MKKRIVLAGMLTGMGIYALTKKDVRENLIEKAQLGKQKVDVGLEKIISSLNTLSAVQDLSDEELTEIVDEYLKEEEKQEQERALENEKKETSDTGEKKEAIAQK